MESSIRRSRRAKSEPEANIAKSFRELQQNGITAPYRQTDRQTGTQTKQNQAKQTDRQTDGQRDTQTGKQAGRKKERTDRQTAGS